MKTYPIIFGPHGGLVAGNGFIAHVEIRGRCLFEETGDDFVSVLGVTPGAVASDGDTIGEAYHAFLERIRIVVFDIAEETSSFEDFKAEVHRFVNETNGPNETIWRHAVESVRKGETDLEGVNREDADGDFWVKVTLIATEDRADGPQHIEPRMNEPAGFEEFKIAAGF